jgi:peptidyl-prolyl cis-trans isomerase D
MRKSAAWGKAHADLFRSLTLSRITITTSEADANKLLKNIQDKKASFDAAAKASSKDSFALKAGSRDLNISTSSPRSSPCKDDADKLAALKAGDLSSVLKTTAGTWVFFKADAEVAPCRFLARRRPGMRSAIT